MRGVVIPDPVNAVIAGFLWCSVLHSSHCDPRCFCVAYRHSRWRRSGPDKKYVSSEDSTFLRVCKLGEKYYVGKLIHERLTTKRVDDVCRNVFSILNRLFPDERLPRELEILAIEATEPQSQSGTESEPAGGRIW